MKEYIQFELFENPRKVSAGKYMKCPKCNMAHKEDHPHFKVISKLKDSGFPTHSKKYSEAHKKANKEEKKKFGSKPFKEMEKVDRDLPKHQLAGKNLKTGKLEVSEKVPKKFRKEVAFHEAVESKALKQRKKHA